MNDIQILFNGPLLIQFIVFVALIAITLLWFDQNVHNMGIDILFAVNCLLSESLLNWISCKYGSNLTICFLKMGNIAYSALWYRFPLSERHSVRMIIRRAHTEFNLTGYGLFNCSMDTFLAVKCR